MNERDYHDRHYEADAARLRQSALFGQVHDRAAAQFLRCTGAGRGQRMLSLGCGDGSIELRLAPHDDYAHYNLGLHHLKYGEYAEGWEGYEHRRSFDNFVGRYRRFALPEWDGGPLEGRAVLVLPEQGLGDEIMFGSCIPDLAAQARHLIIECDPKLEAIFRRSFAGCTVVSRGRTLANDWINRVEPKPDLQLAAGSLARRFRRRAEDFPQRPFLQANAHEVSRWKTTLDALGPGRKIGLSWRGGVAFTGRKRRSFSLEELLPVLRLPGVQFVNLQYTDVR